MNIIGIDECGIGALAGHVSVGAVVLPEGFIIEGVKDSKKLSEKQRLNAIKSIDRLSLFWAVALSDSFSIDKYGIKECTNHCMFKLAKLCINKFPESKNRLYNISKKSKYD